MGYWFFQERAVLQGDFSKYGYTGGRGLFHERDRAEMHAIRLVPCTFLNVGKPPPKKSTIFALRTRKNCLLVRFSLGLGFHAVTYTGWISFSVENKHSGSVYSYKSDRMLLHVFPGKNSIFLSILAKKTLNALFFEPFLLNQRIFISFMQFWKTNPSFLWKKFWFHPFLIFTILAICIFIN